MSALVLREINRAELDLRWTFEVRSAAREPIVIVVRSTRSGIVSDLQKLGPVGDHVDWPPNLVEAVAARIREEIARAKLAAILAGPARRRAA